MHIQYIRSCISYVQMVGWLETHTKVLTSLLETTTTVLIFYHCTLFLACLNFFSLYLNCDILFDFQQHSRNCSNYLEWLI